MYPARPDARIASAPPPPARALKTAPAQRALFCIRPRCNCRRKLFMPAAATRAVQSAYSYALEAKRLLFSSARPGTASLHAQRRGGLRGRAVEERALHQARHRRAPAKVLGHGDDGHADVHLVLRPAGQASPPQARCAHQPGVEQLTSGRAPHGSSPAHTPTCESFAGRHLRLAREARCPCRNLCRGGDMRGRLPCDHADRRARAAVQP